MESKNLSSKLIPYISEYIYNIYTMYIRNVSVATDEGPSPKLALSEDGSRGNIES